MLTRERSAPITVKCALLFLIFAVFGMGTHARLFPNRANGSSPNGAAKLSIEERSVQSLFPEENKPRQLAPGNDPLAFPFALLFKGNTCHFSLSCQVEVSLCTPCRYDSLGPDRMHLPPPTHS
jgi:hypothetical protein